MYSNSIKNRLAAPISALILASLASLPVYADKAIEQVAHSDNMQNTMLIDWNTNVQASLSKRMDKQLNEEMQSLIAQTTTGTALANSEEDVERDLVLVSTDDTQQRVVATSTTPVVVIIDREKLCLLNI